MEGDGTAPTTSAHSEVPDLKGICARFVALSLFQANIRWRRLSDVTRTLKGWLADAKLPALMKKQIYDALGSTFREVQRWGEKHMNLFTDEKPRLITGSHLLRAHRGEHLRTFYGCLTWKPHKYEIADAATAKKIMLDECANWPQMQFQFACAYADLELLCNQNVFDRVRLRAFSKKLNGHCLYDFWLTILNSAADWENMFSSDAVAPKQKLSLVFQFAIANGYYELMHFIWERVTEVQREYVGILQWKRVCFKAKHKEVMQFLCKQLCAVNPNALARITWNTFYYALHKSIQDDTEDERDKWDNMRKMEFLLANCCPRLRCAMLSTENFKVVMDAFSYNQTETFALFLEYLNPEQLRSAREFVDRIYDRKKNEEIKGLRQMVIRRQNTIG